MAQYNATKAQAARAATAGKSRLMPFFKKKELVSGSKEQPGENVFRVMPLTETVMFPMVSLSITTSKDGKDVYRTLRKAQSYGIQEYFESIMPQEWAAGSRPMTVADFLHDVMLSKGAKDARIREKVKLGTKFQDPYKELRESLYPVLVLQPDSEGCYSMPAKVVEGDIKLLQLDGNLAGKFFGAVTLPKNRAFSFGKGKAISLKKGKGSKDTDVEYVVGPAVEDAEDMPLQLTKTSYPLYSQIGTALYEGEPTIKDQWATLCEYYGVPSAESEVLWEQFNQLPMPVTVYDDGSTTMELVIEWINENCRKFIEDSIAEDVGTVTASKPAPAKPAPAAAKPAPAAAKPAPKPAAKQVEEEEPAYANDALDEPQEDEDTPDQNGAEDEAGEPDTAAEQAPPKYNPDRAVAAAKPAPVAKPATASLRKPPIDYTQD